MKNINQVIIYCAVVSVLFALMSFDRPHQKPQVAQTQSDTTIVFSDTIFDTIRSEGTDFWLTFMYQDDWFEDGDTVILELILSSHYDNEVTVSNPRLNWTQNVTVKKDSLAKITIPNKIGLCMEYTGKIEQKAIHVKAKRPISVYASNFHNASFDATNILPLEALGKRYIIQTYKGQNCPTPRIVEKGQPINYTFENFNGYAKNFVQFDTIPDVTYFNYLDYKYLYELFLNSYGMTPEEADFNATNNTTINCDTTTHNIIIIREMTPACLAIVGIEDNTQITITPSIDTYDGHPAHLPYSITLNSGETYQTVGDHTIAALSGTQISADKNIAVFNGDVCSFIPDSVSACDHLVEQAMPTDIFGKTFIVTRAVRQRFNRVLITATEDNTDITINGTLAKTVNALETYEFNLDTTNLYVETSKNAACYLYIAGASANNNEGDPSMVWITPIEQSIKQKSFAPFFYHDKLDQYGNQVSNINAQSHYINIIAPTNSLRDITFDNQHFDQQQIDTLWHPIDYNHNYSYARLNITTDTHTIINEEGGFTAWIYGIGNYESYAYNIGSELYIPSERLIKIKWDIDTLCNTASQISINIDSISTIDSISYYAVNNQNVRYNGLVADSYSHIYDVKVGTDTLYAFAYIGTELKHQIVIPFGAKFPATSIRQKWNDFIGVITNNEDGMYTNGGYDFVAYQWYRNDTLLEGETGSYIYQDLIIGAEYSAMLTTADGISSMTCPIIAVTKTNLTPFPTLVQTTELLRNPLSENVEMSIYNITGQLVSRQSLTPENPEFHAPDQQGNYIVQFTTAQGMKKTYKMIVK